MSPSLAASLVFVAGSIAAPSLARAQAAPAPAPTTAASPAPSTASDAANDPCGGDDRLLATLNRPTVGYSVCAVPKGSVVLEEGYQLTSQRGPTPSVTVNDPQGFERLGVANRFEVDLIGPNFNRTRSDAGIASGYNDLGLGFKYEFDPKGKFTYAIDGLFTPPDGDRAFTAGGTTEQFNFDIGYALSPAVGIAATLGGVATYGMSPSAPNVSPNTTANLATSGNPYEQFGYAIPSCVITVQTPPAIQFYLEWVAQTKTAPGAGGRTFLDGGVQKLLGRNVEIDAEYGYGLSPGRYRYFGTGFGLRV